MNECLLVQVIQILLIIQELLYFFNLHVLNSHIHVTPFAHSVFPAVFKIKVKFTPEQALKGVGE
jgi:hypothetical protein